MADSSKLRKSSIDCEVREQCAMAQWRQARHGDYRVNAVAVSKPSWLD